MEEMDRRGLFLSAMAAFVAATSKASAQPLGPMTTAQLSKSRVIKFKDIPTRKLDNGGLQRVVMSGTLPTGEFIEIHETVLPAGQTPHASHKHPNSEWLFIQSGQLEYVDEGGKVIPVEPNDIVFSASNIDHGLRNIGTTPATYIVFSVSKQLETPTLPR
jgi:mannose-6-phosphate isomerase-like protein (cupin superfamily)